LSSDTVDAIGQYFIDEMLKRTKKRLDVSNSPLKAPYSREYVKSDSFKRFGKSEGVVNMKLTGDMLNDLDFEKDGQTIKLKFNDEVNTLKAANHNKGVTVPERQFFGVTSDMIESARKKFSSDIEADKEKGAETFKTLADFFIESKTTQSALGQFIDERLGVFFDFEDL